MAIEDYSNIKHKSFELSNATIKASSFGGLTEKFSKADPSSLIRPAAPITVVSLDDLYAIATHQTIKSDEIAPIKEEPKANQTMIKSSDGTTYFENGRPIYKTDNNGKVIEKYNYDQNSLNSYSVSDDKGNTTYFLNGKEQYTIDSKGKKIAEVQYNSNGEAKKVVISADTTKDANNINASTKVENMTSTIETTTNIGEIKATSPVSSNWEKQAVSMNIPQFNNSMNIGKQS